MTEYTGSYEWTGNVYISCGDYGLNDRTYAVKADPTQGLVLSQVAALMHPGEAFDLSVNDNTGLEGHVITRTSSNPEVATIDEFGRVEALAPGQTVITVSAGEDSAVCQGAHHGAAGFPAVCGILLRVKAQRLHRGQSDGFVPRRRGDYHQAVGGQ